MAAKVAARCAVETGAARNLKTGKKKSTDRIDGLVAAIMALGRPISDPYREIHWIHLIA